MSDPQPWLDEALSIRREIADLHDRLTALAQVVPKRMSNEFQVQTLQAAQRDLAGAQHWISASEAAMRSKHRLPEEPR